MVLFTLAFLLGDLLLQIQSNLPSFTIIFLLLIISTFVGFFLKNLYRHYAFLPCIVVLGFLYAAWQANAILSHRLEVNDEGKSLLLKGYISSLPKKDYLGQHFIFSQRVSHGEYAHLFCLTLHGQKQNLRVGDQWQFMVRLKRIHGTQNPGSFDMEAWGLQEGLQGRGYILDSPLNKWLNHSYFHHPIEQLRQYLQNKIQAKLPVSNTSAWLLALMIGERENILASDWEILRHTGTNHLMAIAGLHIGLLTMISYMIANWCFRQFSSFLLKLPAQEFAMIFSWFVAFIYSIFAGFSLPTKRAFIMLSLFILSSLRKKIINAWAVWSLALGIVILLNPLCVLTESFYFSFGTLALIIYGMNGRLAPNNFWWKHGRVQWVIGLGLIPIVLFFFQECSLVSFVANSIAIPWLGLTILPCCFLAMIFLFVSPNVAGYLLIIADHCLSLLWWFLNFISQFHFAIWQQTIPNIFYLLFFMLAFLWLLVPIGFPGRWLGICWLLPLYFYEPKVPAVGDVWLTLLDVGQGLSVVVQTHEHQLIYDAGPKYFSGLDMGERVVVPYLRTLSTKKIDRLVVSHGDNDHFGGAKAILKSFPVNDIFTSVPEKFIPEKASYCFAGLTWQWDHVNFSFIYPTPDTLNLNNDSSCVLKIDNGKESILLTGDIEKYAEHFLLNESQSVLAANILVAPHHGSKTSGLKKFIAAVHPQYVLYPIGYRNRYHFPHPSVVKAYKEINAKQADTAFGGMIQLKLEKTKNSSISLYRLDHRRYWYD